METALKSAIDLSGKTRFLAFFPAFHGRTGYALALTGTKAVQKERYPSALEVLRLPYPAARYTPPGTDPADYAETVLQLADLLLTVQGKDLAAIVVEPVAGEAGVLVPPPNFLPGLRKLAEAHDIYLIVDEVQVGLGRTGKLWATEHWSVTPDYLVSAKALGAGFPLAATIGPAPLFTANGRHSETFGAEPYAAAMALAQLAVILEVLPQIPERAQKLEELLRDLQEEFPVVRDVRGLGLFWAIDFYRPGDRDVETARARRTAFLKAAVEERLLLLPAGETAVRLLPPLDTTEEVLQLAVQRIRKALERTQRSD